jgi:hypothetical protein
LLECNEILPHVAKHGFRETLSLTFSETCITERSVQHLFINTKEALHDKKNTVGADDDGKSISHGL